MDNEIVLVFLIVGAIVVAASFVSISLRDNREKKELEITRVRWQLADEWKARSERNRAAKEFALATEVLRKLAVGVAPVECQFPMNQDWLNSVGEPAGSHREEISFDEAVNRALNAAHRLRYEATANSISWRQMGKEAQPHDWGKMFSDTIQLYKDYHIYRIAESRYMLC